MTSSALWLIFPPHRFQSEIWFISFNKEVPSLWELFPFGCQTLRTTSATTLKISVAPKDYIAAFVAMSQHVAIGPRYKNTSTSLNYETTGSNTCNKSQAQTHICTRLCEYKDEKKKKRSQTKGWICTVRLRQAAVSHVRLYTWEFDLTARHTFCSLLTKRKSLLCSVTFPRVPWSSSLKAEPTRICLSVFVYEVSVSRTHYTSHLHWRLADAARCVLHL